MQRANLNLATATARRRAATRIQSAYRGHLTRRELVENVRKDFEEVMRRVEGPLAEDVALATTTPFSVVERPFSVMVGWGKAGSSANLSPPSVLDALDDSTTLSPSPEPPTRAARVEEDEDEADEERGGGARAAKKAAAAIDAASARRGGDGDGVVDIGVGDEDDDEATTSALRQELAWAQAALDDRRQHLRRMRMRAQQASTRRAAPAGW